MNIPPRNRDGVVLLLALLCLVAIEITAVGLHFIAMQEWRTSQAAARDAELRLEARAAVARAVSAWPATLLDSLPLNGIAAIPAAAHRSSSGITSQAEIERVGKYMFLVRGAAQSPLLELTRVSLLVETTTADRLALEIDAALRTNGVVRLGTGSRIDAAADTCSGPAAPDAVQFAPGGLLVNNGGVISGVAGAADSANAVDRAGPLTRHRLMEIAAASPADHGVTYIDGSQSISGVQGPVVLVVDGDVLISGGSFNGILLVHGDVTMSGGARVTGTLIVDGAVTLDNATITYSACAVHAALDRPSLHGPFLPRGRRWIPVF